MSQKSAEPSSYIHSRSSKVPASFALCKSSSINEHLKHSCSKIWSRTSIKWARVIQHVEVSIPDILLSEANCRGAIRHHPRSTESQAPDRANEDRLVPAALCCNSQSVVPTGKAGISAVRDVVRVEPKVESAIVSRETAVVNA